MTIYRLWLTSTHITAIPAINVPCGMYAPLMRGEVQCEGKLFAYCLDRSVLEEFAQMRCVAV
jgi:hypothetical protein